MILLGPKEMEMGVEWMHGTVTTPIPSNNYNGSNNIKKKIKKKKRTKGKGGDGDYGANWQGVHFGRLK